MPAQRNASSCMSGEELSQYGRSGPVPYEGLARVSPDPVACHVCAIAFCALRQVQLVRCTALHSGY